MKRLIDDPQIAGELRAEMQRYAAEQAEVDLKRAYASLEARLPLTAASPTGAPRGRFTSSGWSALSGTTKLLIVAALGGTAALGVAAWRSGEQPIAQSPPAAALPSTELGQAAAPSPVSATLRQSAASPHSDASQPSAAVAPESSTIEPAGAPTPSSTAGRGRSSASRREIAQLARIKSLLEQDPAAARRLIKAAQREFPAGLLVEEREGLDAIALFALAQPERARTQAERFIARYPQSPLRPKLERLIAGARE